MAMACPGARRSLVALVAAGAALVSSPALAGKAAAKGKAGAGAALEVTFLGNEGYLLRAGPDAVLIDGLLAVKEDSTDGLAPSTFKRMLERKPPFASIKLSLTSHEHDDHLDPPVAGDFLAKHPETTLACAAAILGALEKGYAGWASVSGQTRTLTPKPGAWSEETLAGLKVEFADLPHLAKEFYPTRMMVHVIHLGGRKVVHFGDAELTPETLAPLKLAEKGIDVAFVPLWLFNQPGAKETLDKLVGARRLVVMRLPLDGVKKIEADLKKRFPNVAFLIKPMETAKF